jgi:hypothetical protein
VAQVNERGRKIDMTETWLAGLDITLNILIQLFNSFLRHGNS